MFRFSISIYYHHGFQWLIAEYSYKWRNGALYRISYILISYIISLEWTVLAVTLIKC